MAKFDVYRTPDGSFLLDCQANVLWQLNSRFVVPLGKPAEHGGGDPRLNPVVKIDDDDLVMLTHFAAAIPAKGLSSPVASLANYEYEIGVALDRLIGGY